MPFRRIDIMIGKQLMQARPIEWDTDLDGHDGTGLKPDDTYMRPTKFETVCPYCSQLLQFYPINISVTVDKNDNYLHVMCSNCIAKTAINNIMTDTKEILRKLRSIDLYAYSFMAIILAENNGNVANSKNVIVQNLKIPELNQPNRLFRDPIAVGLLSYPGVTLVS